MSELVMNCRVVWDCTRLKQIDEAKKIIRKYRSEGYQIIKPDGNPLEKFSPYLEEVVVKAQKVKRCVMKILCDKGDDRITWDKDNGNEAKEAKYKFEELVGKGYMAFSVDSEGKKNHKIEEFDIDAEEILLVPPTSKG